MSGIKSFYCYLNILKNEINTKLIFYSLLLLAINNTKAGAIFSCPQQLKHGRLSTPSWAETACVSFQVHVNNEALIKNFNTIIFLRKSGLN